MSNGITLGNKELNFIALFETISSIKIKDCIVDEKFNRTIFIVEPQSVGLAVGKKGENVQMFKKLTKLDAEIVPFYNTPENLIKGCFFPFNIKNIKITVNNKGEKIAFVYVDSSIKAKIIGSKGKNITKAKIIARRYFDIRNIIVV